MLGRTCLVTGATSGIGKQTALRLAMLGATVVIVARDAATADLSDRSGRRRSFVETQRAALRHRA